MDFIVRSSGRLNHTCYRISDPSVSLPFYRDGLGLRLFFVFNTGHFTIYYLGYPKETKTVEVEEVRSMQQREGLLELVHVEGADVPALGPAGHIVSGVEQAWARLHALTDSASLRRPAGARASPSPPSQTPSTGSSLSGRRLPSRSALQPTLPCQRATRPSRPDSQRSSLRLRSCRTRMVGSLSGRAQNTCQFAANLACGSLQVTGSSSFRRAFTVDETETGWVCVANSGRARGWADQ